MKSKQDKQLLSLTAKAKKYPSAKKKIRDIKKKQAWNDWLSR